MSTAIEKREEKALTPVDRQMLGLMKEFDKRDTRLENLLPPDVPVDRFKEGIRFALAQEPNLLKCDPGSIMIACMKAAKLGVDVSGGALGHGYLVPFGSTCTFVQGYKGLVALAVSAGIVEDMQPVNVYEKDEFVLEEGVDPVFIHRPFVPRKRGEARGEIIAVYTRVLLPSGRRVIKGLLYLDDIERVEASVKGRNTPWHTANRPEMVKKSSVRNAFKTLGVPASEQARRFREALEQDAEDDVIDGSVVVESAPASGNARLKEKLKQQKEEKVLPESTGSTFAGFETSAGKQKEPARNLPISHPDAQPPEDEPGSEG